MCKGDRIISYLHQNSFIAYKCKYVIGYHSQLCFCSILRYTSCHCQYLRLHSFKWQKNWWKIKWNLKGSSCGLTEVPSQHMLAGAEENLRKICQDSQIPGQGSNQVPLKIQMWWATVITTCSDFCCSVGHHHHHHHHPYCHGNNNKQEQLLLLLLTYLLTKLSPSWEAANCAAIQGIPRNFKEPKGLSPCSQKPSTGPYPEPVQSSPYHPNLSL
jgi:hypothetical protein